MSSSSVQVKTRIEILHDITNFDADQYFKLPNESLSFTLLHGLPMIDENNQQQLSSSQQSIILNHNNKHMIHNSNSTTTSSSTSIDLNSSIDHDQPKLKRYKQNDSSSPILLSINQNNNVNGNLTLKTLLSNSSSPSANVFLSFLGSDNDISKQMVDDNDNEVKQKSNEILSFLEDEEANSCINTLYNSNNTTTIIKAEQQQVALTTSNDHLQITNSNNEIQNSYRVDLVKSSVDLSNNENNNINVDNNNNNNVDSNHQNNFNCEINLNNNTNNNQNIYLNQNNELSNVSISISSTPPSISASSSCVPFITNLQQQQHTNDHYAINNTNDIRKSAERNVPEEEIEEEEECEEEEEFNPWIFMKHLPKVPQVPKDRPTNILPPKQIDTPKISLVLDLDETLVHCSTDPIDEPDLTFTVTFNGIDYKVFAKKRPFFEEFLVKASLSFELIIFTASQEVYANKLLDMIDPNHYIKHRLFRDSCVYYEGNYLKDLSIIGRDLSHTVIVDNSPQSFGFQVDNGIPIESWFEDQNDKELMTLISFLDTLKDVDDVRPAVRHKYGIQDLIDRS